MEWLVERSRVDVREGLLDGRVHGFRAVVAAAVCRYGVDFDEFHFNVWRGIVIPWPYDFRVSKAHGEEKRGVRTRQNLRAE